MTVQAVGAYFRILTEERGLKTLAVTHAAGVYPNYIWRLEAGRIKSPAASIIARLTEAVQGDPEDVADLLLDKKADEAKARQLALARLKPDIQAQIRKLEQTPEGRQALIDAAQRHLARHSP